MSNSPQGFPSNDDYLEPVKSVDQGGRGEDHQQRHENRHQNQQQLQSSATGVPSRGHVQKTNYSDKESKHQQQQQSGIPSSPGLPQKNTNPGNLHRPNNNSLQPSAGKVSDSSPSGYQDLKPQLPPPVTVPPQGFPSKANGLPIHQSSAQLNERAAPIQDPRQQSIPNGSNSSSYSPQGSRTLQEKEMSYSTQGSPSKGDYLPSAKTVSQGGRGEDHPQSHGNSYHQQLRSLQSSSTGVPSQGRIRGKPSEITSETPPEQTPRDHSVEAEKYPGSISPTLCDKEHLSQAQNRLKSRAVTETREEVDQNSYSQRERLPKPEGYPPPRPPTTPSKLEPPIQPSNRCSCCSIL